MPTPKRAVITAKNPTPSTPAAKSVEVEVVTSTLESNRPLSQLVAFIGVGGKVTGELSATEYAAVIGDKINSASMGLREASLLGYQASTEGKFQKVLDILTASKAFSSQVLYGLSQTVTRSIPFLLNQSADLSKIGNLDGFRDLLPKIAIADKSSGKLVVAKGQEEMVKRAIAGESPRKLVEEIKAAASGDSKTGGGVSTVCSRLVNIVTSILNTKNAKYAKQDGTTFSRQAGRAAAVGGLTLEAAIEILTQGFNSESAAMLDRAKKKEAAEIAKAEKVQAAKNKKAEKKAAPKAAKLVSPKKKKAKK